jgi:hypothetical protein
MRTHISIFFALGLSFYLGILWEGQKSLRQETYYVKDENDDRIAAVAESPVKGSSFFAGRPAVPLQKNRRDLRHSLNTFQERDPYPNNHIFQHNPDDDRPPLNKFQERDPYPNNHIQNNPGDDRPPLNAFKKRDPYPNNLIFRHNPGDDRPPFDTVVDEYGNITGNVEDLLHFAVIGFGKCGTTSMISWLDAHRELQTYPKEIYDLMFGKVGEMIRKIYSTPVGNFKRGYKSPADLGVNVAVDCLKQYFPKTKLIVGIRHPVRWFQSLYNFRVQNLPPKTDHSDWPRPNDLIGSCIKQRKNTCTHKGEFALSLRNLGKTLAANNHRDATTGLYDLSPLEYRMYDTSKVRKHFPDIQEAVPNPVFLFEMNQLSDDNTTRKELFGEDVAKFLELDTPLPEMVHHKPGMSWAHKPGLQTLKDSMKIDICDDEHLPARKELMRISRGSSVWIREYFLSPAVLNDPNAGVYVSSPEYLQTLLEDWMVDPCGDDAAAKAGSHILEVLPEDRTNRKQLHEQAVQTQ